MTSEWKTSPLRDLVGFISKGQLKDVWQLLFDRSDTSWIFAFYYIGKSFRPVSYTHLDVYKRQFFNYVNALTAAVITLRGISLRILVGENASGFE